MILTPELMAKLKKLAEAGCWTDNEDFAIEDYACGNVDDAFYGGEHTGEVNLARDILDEIGVEYKAQ